MTIRTPDRQRAGREPASRRPRDPRAAHPLLRAIGALVLLVALVLGVPVLLVCLGQALPVQWSALAPAALARPDDGTLLVMLLLGVAWAAWAVMVVSVATEAWAAVRRVPSPRLPGLAAPQRLAGALVAVVVVAVAPGGAAAAPDVAGATHAAGAAESPGTGGPTLSALVTRAAATVGRDGPAASAAALPVRQPDRPVAESLPTITTHRHDTLWRVAERHLGSGERFAEIAALNDGVRQADGRALGPDGRLYPGWTLRLPADTRLGLEPVGSADVEDPAVPKAADPAVETAADPAVEEREVVPGDTLWGIAQGSLGDGMRYPEIFERNEGVRQDDGRRLTDPDLILPGWVLDIPAEDGSEAASEAGADSEGTTPDAALPDLDRAPHAGLPDLDRAPGSAAPTATAAAPEPVPAPEPSGDSSPSPTPPPRPTTAPAPTIDRAALLPDSLLPEAAIPVPAGGVLGVLLLTGLAGELVRRRRQFQRHRHPGERMPMPGSAARELEDLARAAAVDGGAELLERALGRLARQCQEAGVGRPRIRTVRLSPGGLRLDLAEPRPDAVAPFTALDDRHWQLDLAALPTDGGAEPVTWPGLITVGMRDDETVLLDLAEAGTLRIEGPVSVLPGVLRALASELALGPVTDGAARTLCLSERALSEAIRSAMEAGDVAIDAEPDRVAGTLTAAIRRGPQDPGEGDPLELVLADRPLPVVVPGRSGAALVTTDPAAEAGAWLQVRADGTALLLPDGLRLVTQTLAAGPTDALLDLLRRTELPTVVDLREPSGPPGLTRVAERLVPTAEQLVPTAERLLPAVPIVPVRPALPDPARASTGPAPQVLLLGEVRVTGAQGRAESTRIGRLAETAAFVLLNPDSRPSELQSALWPGRRSNPQTCRQMISRTRTWLGRTDDGEPYLMQLADNDGRLRLRAEVGCDWDRFSELAAAGLADPDDTERLAAALRLVRGRPFGTVSARELPWADLFVNEMISVITDVAHELAVRHERNGDWAAAREAALRGLRTESESEVLEGLLVRLDRWA